MDQGDVIDGCPLPWVVEFDLDTLRAGKIICPTGRINVLTQTCDLAQGKTTSAIIALVHPAQTLIDQMLVKVAEVKGPIRAGRVFGWYFLPKEPELSLPESIIDLRHLCTVRLDLLTGLCQRGHRRARLQPLYREHLAKHFGDTYSRIGLPEPYPSD